MFDLLLIGYGNVARRFESLLAEQPAPLGRIVGIATRRHGCAYGAEAVSAFPPPLAGDSSERRRDPAEAQRAEAGRRTRAPADAGHDRQPDTLAFLRDALKRSAAAARQRRLVVVETTTLDIES